MVIFHSYVKLPEGKWELEYQWMEIEQIGVLDVEIAGAEAPLVIWKLVPQNLILSTSFYKCSQKKWFS